MRGAVMMPVPNIFGIPGMTAGAAGIWVLVIMGLIAIATWLIRTAADRKRAENEGITTLSGATDAVIKVLTAEVKRLSEQVDRLTTEVSSLKKELHESREREDALRKAELGVIRGAAQNDISTAKVLKGLGV